MSHKIARQLYVYFCTGNGFNNHSLTLLCTWWPYRIRARKRNEKDQNRLTKFSSLAPIDRAKLEMKEAFKQAEKYRIGILKNISTFGNLSLNGYAMFVLTILILSSVL